MSSKSLPGRVVLVLGALALLFGLAVPAGATTRPTNSTGVPKASAAGGTFTNPVVRGRDDPGIIKYGSNYYYTSTDGCDAHYLCVWKSATLSGLATATKYDVFHIPAEPAPNADYDWAPELHYINGTFYIYYAASVPGVLQHIFVLQATTGDPAGSYVEANTGQPSGELYEASRNWAIDPDVFQTPTGQLYVTWSGRANTTNNNQNIYIAPMSDPLHISGPRVLISQPTRAWETVGGPVNEGPVIFQHGGKTFITYSASLYSTPSYAVGLLTNSSNNLLDPNSWVKTGPIFKYHSGVAGTGSFVPIQSTDGTGDWFLVHDNIYGSDPNTPSERDLRLQPLYWDSDGTPLLGYPVGDGIQIPAPSGELGSSGDPNPFVQGWGHAFGDAAEGDNTDGRQNGNWTIGSSSSASLTSFGGTTGTQLFRASNPNYETYTVSVQVRLTGTGTTSAFPKYGMYASYDDNKNHVEIYLDNKYHVLATHGVVQGVAAAWQNTNLPAGFDATAFHTLSVRKTGATYTFYLDGAQLQQRTFTGTSFPVLLNGQAGVVTEDSTADYQNFAVTNTQ